MDDELAKKRFLILNLVRLFAVVLVFAGIANVGGKWLTDAAPYLGYALIIAGAADFFLTPVILKKAWRDKP